MLPAGMTWAHVVEEVRRHVAAPPTGAKRRRPDLTVRTRADDEWEDLVPERLRPLLAPTTPRGAELREALRQLVHALTQPRMMPYLPNAAFVPPSPNGVVNYYFTPHPSGFHPEPQLYYPM